MKVADAGRARVQNCADHPSGPSVVPSSPRTSRDSMTVTLSPANAENHVGTDHTVTATVTDGNGDPVADMRVIFEVYGPGIYCPFTYTSCGDGHI